MWTSKASRFGSTTPGSNRVPPPPPPKSDRGGGGERTEECLGNTGSKSSVADGGRPPTFKSPSEATVLEVVSITPLPRPEVVEGHGEGLGLTPLTNGWNSPVLGVSIRKVEGIYDSICSVSLSYLCSL